MNKTLPSLVVLLMVAANLFFAHLAFGRGMGHLYEEGELLESLQASFLGLGGIAFLAALPRAEKEFRLGLLASSLLCLTFVLREIDVEDYRLPQILVLLGSGTGRNLLLGSAWLGIAGWAAWDVKQQTRIVRYCLSLSPGRFFLAGGAFILAGSLFDGGLLPLSHSVFWEELAELNGCFLVLQSALACCAGLQRSGVRRRDEMPAMSHWTEDGDILPATER